MNCWHCGLEVPAGPYCTRCGTQQAVGGPAGALRVNRFAANPDERVNQPGIFSSLFPHLSADRLAAYRVAFAVGLAIVVGLAAFGLVSASYLAAAVLLPVLGVTFLIEQRLAESDPRRILVTAVAAPTALGILLAVAAGLLSNQVSPFRDLMSTGIDPGGLIVFAILVPIVQEVAKGALALSLRSRPALKETIDGVVIGVVAGLLFSLGGALVLFAQMVRSIDVVVTDGTWLVPILATAISIPLLHATTTAAVAGSLWRWRRGASLDGYDVVAVTLAVVGHIGFNLGTSLALASGRSMLLVLAWQAVVVVGELLIVRRLLHRALLEEAADLPLAQTTCPNCRLALVAAGFCPSCGLALTAVPAANRLGRVPVEGEVAGA